MKELQEKLEEKHRRELQEQAQRWEEYQKEMQKRNSFNQKVEEVLNCLNLGVDFSMFTSPEEIFECLEDKGIKITKKQKAQIQKICKEFHK